MTPARTRLLLAGWVAATIVPGVVATAAFDIDLDSDGTGSNRLGWALLVWIVGFLGQLALFMAITRGSKKLNVLPWLVASLLPFACDWSTPVSLWYTVPCLALALVVAALVYVPMARSSELIRDGVPARGTVLKVIAPRFFNVTVNDVYIKRKLRLRVARDDGVAPYEAVLDGLYMLGEIPAEGDVFSLRVDPKNPRHFETVDSTTPPAATRTDAARWLPDDAPPTRGDASIADQLERLTQLHASGGLTEAEFAQAKAKVIRG